MGSVAIQTISIGNRRVHAVGPDVALVVTAEAHLGYVAFRGPKRLSGTRVIVARRTFAFGDRLMAGESH